MAAQRGDSVRKQFVQVIEAQILSGERKIGERLPTARELCATMGVSLTTVNTGISELMAKGFVEVKPRQGYFVADYLHHGKPETLISLIQFNGGKLGAAEVRDFCEGRIALDPDVAEWAILRASEEQMDELGERLEALRSCETIPAAAEAITGFFSKLYQLSENHLLTMIYESFIPHQHIMYTTFMEKNGLRPVVENAEEVYAFLRERNIPAVRKCLTDAMRLPLEGETAII